MLYVFLTLNNLICLEQKKWLRIWSKKILPIMLLACYQNTFADTAEPPVPEKRVTRKRNRYCHAAERQNRTK